MANVAETSQEIPRRSAKFRPPVRRGDPLPSGATIALLSPAYGWLLVAVFLPLLAMLAFSFLTATPLGNKPLAFTINNYLAFERRPYLVGVAWESLKLGLWTTGFCAVLGLPAALALARATQGRLRQTLFLLIILPFWTNGLVRIFSWTMVLREGGILDQMVHVVLPAAPSVALLYSTPAVVIGLVHAYLPYMILTCYLAVAEIEDGVIDAARSLGARPPTVFLTVILPLALPGLVSGAILSLRAGDRRLHGAAHLGRSHRRHDGDGDRGPVHGRLQLAAGCRPFVHDAGRRSLRLRDLLRCLARTARGGRSHLMATLGRGFLGAIIVFLYLPIVVMVAMAFNASELYELPFSPTLHWFRQLARNDRLIDASRNSLLIAIATMVLATAIGTLAALALSRRAFRGRTLLNVLLLPPIAIPWLITGTAMLVFFYWTGIGRGLHAMIIGHVALAIPYVVLVVGTALKTLRADLEEAAMSLGSTPIHAFVSITLPLLAPSIVAAALFAFAVSLDQFVISYFLATPGVSTLPVEIYSSIRKGFTPEINAVSTLLLGVSISLVLVFALLSKPGGNLERR